MVFFLFLIVVVVGIILFFRLSNISEKILSLEWEVGKLKHEINELQSHRERELKSSASQIAVETVIPSPVILPLSKPSVNTQEEVIVQKPVIEKTQPIPTSVFEFRRPLETSRTKEEWEALIGGKLLNRIGSLALVIGIGFFLKYAFDNNWISETARVLIGAFIGGGLLFGAFQAFKKEYQIFAQGLMGAGISILYLSIYASFNFYHLVSQPVAFGLMSVVTTLTFLSALKYDSLAVSVLGWAGGFLTPIMLSTGHANEIGLFTYIALLDVGILAIVLMKQQWYFLEPLSLLTTYFFYMGWFKEYYSEEVVVTGAFFLFVFWMLFLGTEFWRNLKSIKFHWEYRSVVLSFGSLFFYGNLYWTVNDTYPNEMALLTFFIGIVYFSIAYIVSKKNIESHYIVPLYAVSSITMLVVATAIYFSGFTIVIFWSVELLALFVCATRWNLGFVWKSALVLLTLTAIKLLTIDNSIIYFNPDSYELLFNKRALTYFILILSCGSSALLFRSNDSKTLNLVKSTLHYTWGVSLLFLIVIETNDYFGRARHLGTFSSSIINFHEVLVLSTLIMLYALGMSISGGRWKNHAVLYCGIGGFVLSILIALLGTYTFHPIEQFLLIVNVRTALLVFLICSTILFITKIKFDEISPAGKYFRNGFELTLAGLIFFLLTIETIDFFQQKIYFAESSRIGNQLENFMQMSLSVVWLFYSIVLMVIGIWKQTRGIRIISIVIFGFTILKIFSYDLSFLETLYRIFSFVGLGLILLAVSYLYQRYKDLIFGAAKSEN